MDMTAAIQAAIILAIDHFMITMIGIIMIDTHIMIDGTIDKELG